LQCQMYRGKSIFATFKAAAEIVPQYETLKTSMIPSIVTVCIFRPVLDVPKPRICEVFGTPQEILKGKHITQKDVVHFRANTYAVAIKRDGVATILTIDSRGLTCDGEVLHADMPQFGRPIYIHCEKIGTKYVALDLLPQSFTYPNMMFLFRYRFMLAMVHYAKASGYRNLDYNVHYFMRATCDLAQFIESDGFKELAQDGIVLVPHSGMTHAGYTPTRYIKRVKTVDVLGPSGIEERFIDKGKIGEIRRMRPDKREPNHPTAIKELMSAPDYKEVLRQLASQFDIKIDLIHLEGLDVKKCYIPDEDVVHDETWTQLYIGRSAIESQYAGVVAQWMRVRGVSMRSSCDNEIEHDRSAIIDVDSGYSQREIDI